MKTALGMLTALLATSGVALAQGEALPLPPPATRPEIVHYGRAANPRYLIRQGRYFVPAADLVVTGLRLGRVDGDRIAVSLEVRNEGAAWSPACWATVGGDHSPPMNVRVPALAPGGVFRIETRPLIDSRRDGAIVALVDVRGAVTEPERRNNIARAPLVWR